MLDALNFGRSKISNLYISTNHEFKSGVYGTYSTDVVGTGKKVKKLDGRRLDPRIAVRALTTKF